MNRYFTTLSLFVVSAQALAGTAIPVDLSEPVNDRWMYPFNGTPGARAVGPTFAAFGYDTFDEPLGRFIERAQAGATHHVGRGVDQESSKSSRRREERQLMRALENALNREQYEKAAEIRDRINQLSAELESQPEEAHDGSEGADQ